MPKSMISAITLFTVAIIVIGVSGLLLIDTMHRQMPYTQVSNAWQMAQLSGAYEFRSEVDQITNYPPRLSNYAKPSVHEQYVIEGSVDESNQTTQLAIINRTNSGASFEVRRTRGQTYTRQRGGKWTAINAIQDVSQLNALSYLAGMRDITVKDKNNLSYGFVFDGKQFTDHFARLLAADQAHGITHNADWYSVAQSAQLRQARGDGTISIDKDGLPSTMAMTMTMPETTRTGAVNATIKTTFLNYARTGLVLQRMLHQPLNALSFMVGFDIAATQYAFFVLMVVLALLLLGVVVSVFGRRLTLPLTLLVVGIMVFQPFSGVATSRAATQTAPVPTPQPAVPFNPLVSPLDQVIGVNGVALPAAGVQTAPQMTLARSSSSRALSTRADTTADVDSDGDGLSDNQETLLGTNTRNADSDGDGLNDFQEAQIGTNPKLNDTDGDGLSDFIEVKYPSTYGTAKYYTSPFTPDTNSDGSGDMLECPEHLTSGTAACRDSDSDSIPDFLDFDNDNDSVPDAYDMVPDIGRKTAFTDSAPFTYSVTDSSTSSTPMPLVVSFQFRPSDPKLLYGHGAVYDWPSNDKQGQIQRVNDTTFAASLNNPASDSSASNGDMKISGMIEIRVPVSASSYGNLPLKACVVTNTCGGSSDDRTPAWLDTSKLSPYGINAVWATDIQGQKKSNEVTLLVPINPVYDNTGSIVAYEAVAYYETATKAWESNHQARLMWIVSAIQDVCPPDKSDCSDSERISQTTSVHNYYGEFALTGLKASELQPFKSTVVYEDVAQTAVNGTQRRLQISKLARMLDNAFMSTPFLEVNSTDATKSIPSLFDNRKNATLATLSTYGIDPSATRASTFQYSTPFESIKISSTEIPNILNQLICRKTTTTEDCTGQTPAQLLSQCETDMTPRCKPAVLIASEGRERTAVFDKSTNRVTFTNVSVRITRSLNGQMYKVMGGKWAPYENIDIGNEISAVQTQVAPALDASGNYVGKPSTIDTDSWQQLYGAVATAIVGTFFNPKQVTMYADIFGKKLSGITPSNFKAPPQPNWSGEVTDIVNLYQPYFVQAANTSADADDGDDGEKAQNIADQTALASGVLAGLGGIADADSARSKGLGAGDTAVAAGTFIVNAIDVFGSGTKLADHQATVDNVMASIQLVMAIADAVGAYKDYAEAAAAAAKAVAGAASAVESVGKIATLTDTIGKKLGIVGVAISIAATWATAIISIKNAEFAYQKANAISAAIGQTAVIILMVILSATGIGALVAAIIGALDALANLICKNISPEKQRSTAGQWLCGGVSGILANLFSPFAANLVIDPSDSYSRKQEVMPQSPKLATSTQGFRVGNGWVSNMKVADYIDRMPFPATWMALPYFWQWNAQDERDTAFIYALNKDQIDLTGSISLGSQFNDWSKNTDTRDDYKGFKWRKEMSLSYNTAFTQSGINQTLPAVWMSEASKVAQQNCFAIWIPLPFFPFPIPVCYIKTAQDTKYTNLNEDDTTIFDVFPSTFGQFTTMQAKGNGYTFNWSPEVDDQPTFPVFKDADNDGVPNSLELTQGSIDNNYDSDGDGVDDNREIALGSNLSSVDSDNDGLTDLQEYQFGTDPNRIDTDGDGLIDGEEIVRSVNGVRVGGWDVTYAIINNVPQTTWVSSDPLQSDGDGDGIIDVRERILGWSPYAKNSGDIVGTDGTVNEGLNPILAVNFETQGAAGFVNNGLQKNALTCVSTCPTVVSDRPNSKSIGLNGNQHYNAGTGNMYQFGQQFSVAAWLKPSRTFNNTLEQYDAIIGQYGQFQIMRKSDGKLAISLSTTTGNYEFLTGVVLLSQTWTHVVVTYDGAVLVIYTNGNEATRYVISGRVVDSDTGANDLRIGGWQKSRAVLKYGMTSYESGTSFVGGMDDIAIYQVALRAYEVRLLMQNTLTANNDLIVRPGDRVVANVNLQNKLLGRTVKGLTTINTQSSTQQPIASVDAPLALGPNSAIATNMLFTVSGSTLPTSGSTVFRGGCLFAGNQLCLRLDEPSDSTAFADLSEYSRTVTCSIATAACPRYSAGSWVFDNQNGTPNVVIAKVVGDSISQRDFTMSMWVRPLGQSTVTRSLLVNNNTATPFRLDLSTEKPRFKLGTSADLMVANPLPLGQWSHLTFSVSAGLRAIYVNGVLAVKDSVATSYSGSIGALVIGADASRNLANGNIRDIQIYNGALKNPQILTIAGNCDDINLLSCVPFNGSSVDYAPTALDQGITLNCGSCTTASTTTMNVPATTTFPTGYARLVTGHDLTIVFKLRFSGLPSVDNVIWTTGGSNRIQINVQRSSGSVGVPTFTIGGKSITAGTMTTNTWYMLTARYEAGKMTLVVNAVDGAGTGVTATTATAQNVATPVLQDAINVGAANLELDSLRVYRMAVSDDTIAALAQLQLIGTQTGLVNTVPASDVMAVNADTRVKVIQSDANFEILPTANMCTAASMLVCMPFKTATIPSNTLISACDPNTSCPVVSQSGADFSGNKYYALNNTVAWSTFVGANSFTVMTWVRLNAVGGDQAIITDRQTNFEDCNNVSWNKDKCPQNRNNKLLRMIVRGGKLHMGYYNNDLNGNTTLAANTWYHVAFVKSNSGRALYINGVLDASDAATTNLSETRNLGIGLVPYEASNATGQIDKSPLNGRLSDFQVHKAALTQTQINQVVQTAALELRVPFDEPALTMAFGDAAASDLQLTCVGNCPISGVTGRDDRGVRFMGKQALGFNPLANGYIASNLAGNAANYTLSMWVKPTSYGTWLVGNSSGTPNKNLRIGINADGKVTYERSYLCGTSYCWPSTPLVSNETVALGMWSHITMSAGFGTEYLYVNGNTPATRAQNAPTVVTNSDPVVFGQGFVGDMDEIRVSPNPTTSNTPVLASMKQAPSWNLRFEDTLKNDVLTVSNNITKTATIDGAMLPDNVPARWGINRLNYAANCENMGVSGVECPAIGAVGMAGLASDFNGSTTMLQVDNSATLIGELANGGTVQMMVRPDSPTKTPQTILSYGDTSGNTVLRVRLINNGNVEIKVGNSTFTSASTLAPAWNQLSFSFGADGFRYFQNGNLDTSVNASSSAAIAALTTNSAWKLLIGGRINGSSLTEPFKGGIDDITFTSTSLDARKVFRLARSQFSQAISKKAIANVTIDADSPNVSLVNPAYVSRIPTQFTIQTSDIGSFVDRVVFTTQPATGAQTSVMAPACQDAVGTTAFCPTFQLNQTPTVDIEGRYGLRVEAYDAVENRGVAQASVLVDTTAPVASLIRNAGTYTTEHPLGTNQQLLTVRLNVDDPKLKNLDNVAGSGVKQVTVSVRDMSARNIITAPVPADYINGAWQATVDLPFINPTGFYMVSATATDNVGNTSAEQIVAGTTNPIEVDSTAPNDLLVSPSPDAKNLFLIGAQAIQGRVSDYYDGRAALQRSLRVRLDFEAPDGAKDFDNRANSRYTTNCTVCPTTANDTLIPDRRIARFNIDGTQQLLTIRNAAGTITDTFSVAVLAKISDTGTMLSVGTTSNPRLRILAEKASTGFKFTGYRGASSVSSAPLAANTWYYLIYNEVANKMSLSYGTQLTSMTTFTTTIASGLAVPPSGANVVLGAIQSSTASATTFEDYFRGYIDDVIISSMPLAPIDLMGRSLALGSGTQTHKLRLDISDDSYGAPDTLGTNARYFAPVNQNTFPVVDAMNGAKSEICSGEKTSPNVTCPQLDVGFSTNAFVLSRPTDGVKLGYSFTTQAQTQSTLALRFKVPSDATSGRIFSLIPAATTISMTLDFAADTRSVVTTVGSATTAITSTNTELLDSNWHTLVMTTSDDATNTVVTMFIDGQQTASGTLVGHWSNARLIVGATSAVLAANGVIVDDIAVFDGELSATEQNDFAYGYSTVYHEQFDDSTATINRLTSDDSPFHQASMYVSDDRNLTMVPGIVGDSALAFDGNDRMIHRDSQGLTFAQGDQVWAMATWLKPAGNTGSIIRGVANGYSYQLQLVDGKPSLQMAGMTLQAPFKPVSDTYHLAISADGVLAHMYINGTEVVSASVGTTALPSSMIKNRAIGGTATQSSTATNGAASKAIDGDRNGVWANTAANKISKTNVENNPWWQVDLGVSTQPIIDAIRISNRSDCCADELSDFYIMVADAPFSTVDTTLNTALAHATWSYRQVGAVDEYTTILLPPNVTGRYVRIQKAGTGQSLTLAEVEILQVPVVVLGRTYTGTMDDLRVYRRILRPRDITQLMAMGWNNSTLTTRVDGFDWQQSLRSGLEVNAAIQSVTSDNQQNTRLSIGEHQLWSGRIDTAAPRIVSNETAITSTGLYSFTMQLDDRNMDVSQIQTPCGGRFRYDESAPQSLWYRTNSSAFDGTIMETTHLSGGCVMSAVPDFSRQATQVVSLTKTIDYGSRYGYAGGNNQILIVDVQNAVALVQNTVAISGTVTQLHVNRAQNRLYAVSMLTTPTSRAIVSIFDIPNNAARLTFRGSISIALTANATVNQIAISTDYAQGVHTDQNLLVLLSGTPQRLVSIKVTNPDQPTQVASIDVVNPTFGMAAGYDVLLLAQGENGLGIYNVNTAGALSFVRRYTTDGFVNQAYLNDFDALVIDDDEPYSPLGDVVSPNTLRILPLIAGVTDGTATITDTITERVVYVHTTPTSDDEFRSYRIKDVVPYLNNDLLLLSTDSENARNNRISMVNTTDVTATLRSDTLFANTGAAQIAALNNNVLLLANQTNTATLTGYQISDRRLATRACDRAANCSVQTATTRSTARLSRSTPDQSDVLIINQANVYTTTNQLIGVRAQAPAGIASIGMQIDGVNVGTQWTAPVSSTLQSVETTFPLIMSAGVHTLNSVMSDNSGVSTSSAVYTFTVDLQAPQIRLTDTTVGLNKLVDGYLSIGMVITDDNDLPNLQIINLSDNTTLPFSYVTDNHVMKVNVFYPAATITQTSMALRVIAIDVARRKTTRDVVVNIDTTAPRLVNSSINALIKGAMKPLTDGMAITRTVPLDLNVAWTQISDQSAVVLRQLEYTVQTVTGTMTMSNTIAPTALRTSALPSIEASRVSAGMRLRDALDNEAVIRVPTVYVDSANTPDYTLIGSDPNSVYRGWLNNGCAVLGSDNRSALSKGSQKFATTWDSQSLRLNWQGADWDSDGDLFIYLDSIPGGTITAYRPSNFVQTTAQSVLTGDAFVTLPINSAARGVNGKPMNLAASINSSYQRLIDAQRGGRVGTVEGADYVVHVQNDTTIALLKWNGNIWENTGSIPEYSYVVTNGTKQTDIRVLFDAIMYDRTQKFGLVAMATQENKLLPWATFPTTNPILADQGAQKIAITPLINAYGWSMLGDNMCPRKTAVNPDTTQIVALLTSTPNGVSRNTIADNFANTDSDAIAEAISETTDLCTALPNEAWCVAVNQLANSASAGTALLEGLANTLVSSQAPYVGSGSLVTYTLQITNPSNRTTKPIYGIVQTYGAIWLTGVDNSAAAEGIISSGNYSYTTALSMTGLRDYQVVKFGPIAANSTKRLILLAKIDANKAQASASDRIRTGNIAKLEVRLTDEVVSSNAMPTRTLEWLNAVVRVDTAAPSQILPDRQTTINAGSVVLRGSVSDDSAVPAVVMEYRIDSATTTRAVNCGAAITMRWQCSVFVPLNASTIAYRLRASDGYGQLRNWSTWYGATVDRSIPQLALDQMTIDAMNAPAVGGSSIAISGLVSDTNNAVSVMVCDEQIGGCENATQSVLPTTTMVYSTTATTSVPIAVQPCAANDVDSYTEYPVTVTNADIQRINTMSIDTIVAHDAVHEVDLWVRSPSGTLVPLWNATTRNIAQNLAVHFNDNVTNSTLDITGTTALTSTLTEIRPDGKLTTFVGEPINGTWSVLACDRNTNLVQGALTYVGLNFTTNTLTVNQSIPWTYTLTDIANSSGKLRNLIVWGVDQAGNSGPLQRVSLNIDTIAPTTSVTQTAQVLLPGNTYTLFEGTVADTGIPQPIEANIYSQSGLIDSYVIPVDVVSRQWSMVYRPVHLATGTYTVQFVIRDVVGNQRTSDNYRFVIDSIVKPTITNVEFPVSSANNSVKLRYMVDTGGDITDISAKVMLDSDATATVTNTTILIQNGDGSSDATRQAAIPSDLHSHVINQLEIDNQLAAVLNSDGSVYTWPLSSTNALTVTNLITDVQQIAMGTQITTTQHLLTLGKNGIVHDYTPTDGITVTSGITVTLPGLATAIDAGRSHYLALLQSGELVGWGSDDFGQITVPDSARMGATQIEAGNDFSVALLQNGKVVAWGKNDLNQATVPVTATSQITQISVGNNHTLALRDDGSVVAWGANDMGQTTVPISATNVLYVVAAADSSAAIRRDGIVVVWGKHGASTPCCAVALAFNDTHTLSIHGNPFSLQRDSVNATLTPQVGQFTFDGLIPGRRYRYTITTTNGAGSTSYTGTFNTLRMYHRIFVPLLSNDASAAVPTGTGR